MRRPTVLPLKLFDYIFLVAAISLTVLSGIAVYGGESKASRVVVEGMDHTWIYPLKAEVTLRVPGPLGDTVVVLHDGSARIEDSPCPNKTCVAAGAVRENGQWVACLPNRVFVRVEGNGHDDRVDGSTW